ncbi:MAG: hypothetical protein ACFFDI_26390, partial [Promethearchaeota archaeon]
TVYLVMMQEGVYVLDPRKLKYVIIDQVDFPKKIKINEELNRFFSLIDGLWRYVFYLPAFGLNLAFFHIQLRNSTPLEEIIDLQNPRNTVMRSSDIYLARTLPNNYIGLLRIPFQDFGKLKIYFQECEHQGKLILKKLEKVITRSFSGSLTYYRANIGWFDPNPTKIRRLTQLLQAQYPKKKEKIDSSFFTPPEINSLWNFKQHPLPSEIIKFFCDISPHNYSYSNLPLQQDTSLTRDEVGLLKQLYYNRVVQINFVSMRLLNEFSIDLYCVSLPKIPPFLLKHFLELIPYCDFYFTEKSINIWARLTLKLVQWIEKDLNWSVIPIRRIIYPQKPGFNHFDQVKLQWMTPDVLQG